MPEWVIVADDADGEPLVLSEWVMGFKWASVVAAKSGDAAISVYRDRWRAKRQARKLPRDLHARCVRLSRL